MKSLRILTVLFLIGITTLVQAQQDKNAPIFSTMIEISDGDEVSLSVIMIDKQKVLIQWKAKTDGVYFEIEKSVDGENYEMIATSDEVISSPDGTAFQYVDENASIENYYRIFYITPSGTVDYSDITFISPLPSDMTLDGLK